VAKGGEKKVEALLNGLDWENSSTRPIYQTPTNIRGEELMVVSLVESNTLMLNVVQRKDGEEIIRAPVDEIPALLENDIIMPSMDNKMNGDENIEKAVDEAPMFKEVEMENTE
jgi:hypothetical protein